jgi:hypothetical protein
MRGRRHQFCWVLLEIAALNPMSLSFIATDGQSASSSRCRAAFGTDDQILISLSDSYFLRFSRSTPSLTRRRISNLQCIFAQIRVAQDP